jgi:hypothetical protein
MHELSLLAGLEALLVVGLTIKLKEMRRLEKEIHLTAFDCALACGLAAAGRYSDAHAAASRWRARMKAHKRRQPPPSPPRREIRVGLH